MADSKLTRLPSVENILANMPDEIDDSWVAAFKTAAMRDYIAQWLQWFTDNRSFFRGDDARELRRETASRYSKIVGQHMPWFPHAVAALEECDPDTQKPVLTLYLNAKVEVLSSLTVYQNHFKQEGASKSAPLFREWINQKIEIAAQNDPPEPFLFSAFANAYEHVFSFLFKMLDQFRRTYDRVPEIEEYDLLTRQLASKLHKEALLSRKENAILETYFDGTNSFFSFKEVDGRLRLDINDPSPEQKSDIWEELHAMMHSDERKAQASRPKAEHYGCPAALGGKERQTTVQFVVQDVIAVVRDALRPSENIQHLRPTERGLRAAFARAPKATAG